ncbi:fatty acid CoA ligase family protein [Fuerstiella marisgermanici]|uniref:Long-chain-fatty-acid--CoA ligase FadD13 n=1 Tax=Fuerstiella marisgermanici TaxID=1891926 RepID=A0A1P8WIT1_9PLAN|nr:fatty acid CoA ligase family protein [Fuerstiella marisgermanici]APZ93958.1 Long-chain-fatty-acid--CoA ligase FadD13 [Fuerstiella marisgermanici]
MPRPLNIADRLRTSAAAAPYQKAVVFPEGRDAAGRVSYTHLTFTQLDQEADRIARGLIKLGVKPGDRLAMFVPPSLESIALTFGVFRSGAVCIMIDPGMGRSNVFRCLDQCEPHGFIAIPIVHVVRKLKFRRYGHAKLNVIIGPKSGKLGSLSYSELIASGRDDSSPLPQTQATDQAAIIFTSGSTGPPKGVTYEHGMFDSQVDLIRDRFGIQPGEVDLPGFPLFALFNTAMQVTTVIPDMNPTRPADVDPVKILESINDHGVTQAFGSPALWNRVGRYCEANAVKLPTLRRVLSAGAPVPNHVLHRMTSALSGDSDIFTPYGATECLPVSAIGGRQVLEQTAAQTAQGAGTCVGTVFTGMQVRIIDVTFDPIADISQAKECGPGQIGEIIVKGPVATREYFRRPDGTALAKISDGDGFWHRMGDTGYFDDEGRLWFCGRKAHIVFTESGPLHSVRCEAIFNQHPKTYRCALVGIGSRGQQIPVIVAEPEAGHFPECRAAVDAMRTELLALGAANELTNSIGEVLFHKSLPVDTRHNVKINRELLAVWAAKRRTPSA